MKLKSRGESQSSLHGAAISSITAAVALGSLVLMAHFSHFQLITPTTFVSITNNLKETIEITGCGLDPGFAHPGEAISLEVSKNDPNASCLLFNNADNYIGCLPIPTTAGYSLIRPDPHIAQVDCDKN